MCRYLRPQGFWLRPAGWRASRPTHGGLLALPADVGAGAARALVFGCCGGKQPLRMPQRVRQRRGHTEPHCPAPWAWAELGSRAERPRDTSQGLLGNATGQSCSPHSTGTKPGKRLRKGSCRHLPITGPSQSYSHDLRAQSRQGPHLCLGAVPGSCLHFKQASTRKGFPGPSWLREHLC